MDCDTLEKINRKIAQAAERSDRTRDSVRLVAVSKRQSMEKIRQAVSCGQVLFGENYLQEAQEKINRLGKNLCWHFIGHLQSNKAGLAVKLFDVIETVDRIKIARLLDKHARQCGKNMEILLQVNIGREKQKHGVLPEHTEALLRAVLQETNCKVRGLMAMPPWSAHPENSRPYFRNLRRLSEQLADKGLFAGQDEIELSMGMSADYTIAVEEGATLVRVGTALFGRRE
ncbi:MAG: YggS family pyridoxal phosphate-dependent enzyme [Desulfobulbus sp.]|nr:MAG: YggS family pyridoxal phosphate-dependent enzyme [Desulfobulbus sp.]